jgi:hypothetical protein
MTERFSDRAPDTKLGNLTNEIVAHFEGYAMPGVRMVVMLDDRIDKLSMTGLSGFEDDREAIVAMFVHLAAVFEGNGKKLMIVPLGGDG